MSIANKDVEKTVELLERSQPLREQILTYIEDPKLLDTYKQIYELIGDLLEERPSGEAGLVDIEETLAVATVTFSS